MKSLLVFDLLQFSSFDICGSMMHSLCMQNYSLSTKTLWHGSLRPCSENQKSRLRLVEIQSKVQINQPRWSSSSQ